MPALTTVGVPNLNSKRHPPGYWARLSTAPCVLFHPLRRQVINHVRACFPRASALFAAGWSLGANILVNYLGEEGANTPVMAAVSM